jgi:hypothetical protein
LLDSGAVVGSDIPGQTGIGHDNTIGYNAVVGIKCQDMKYKVLILFLTLHKHHLRCNAAQLTVLLVCNSFLSVGCSAQA